jgi:hypothetical protein
MRNFIVSVNMKKLLKSENAMKSCNRITLRFFCKSFLLIGTRFQLKKSVWLELIFDADSNGIKIFRKKTSECGEFVPVTKVHPPCFSTLYFSKNNYTIVLSIVFPSFWYIFHFICDKFFFENSNKIWITQSKIIFIK